jgi:Mg2+ and Co2+ transporter CorA
MRDDPNRAASLHPRRSLDQFFYSSLLDTRQRDADQVVSKCTRDSRGGAKMVMVDQLWLWLVQADDPGGKGGPSKGAVFTCFPRKEQELETTNDEDLLAIADLRQAIIDELEADMSLTNGADFVAVVIERAINVMLRVRNEQSLDFLDVFRGAIARLVSCPYQRRPETCARMGKTHPRSSLQTEDQARYFFEFQRRLDAEAPKLGDPKVKREQVKCVLELADIVDELNSVRRLFETQEDVLRSASRALQDRPGYEATAKTLQAVARQDLNGYIKQVDRLSRDAQRTKDAVMSLLDLQQKEDSLKEAIFSNDQALAAREQAEETEAQSQILFLFTVVTIVFVRLPLPIHTRTSTPIFFAQLTTSLTQLPLSFFTSYFGMNVVEFTGEEGNTNQPEVWKVMGPASAAIILGLLGAAFVMYKRTRTQLRTNRKARRKERKENEAAAEAAAETA